MSVEAWRSCLESQIQPWQFPELLLLCVAHRPDIVDTNLLQEALGSQNLPVIAIKLAYGSFSGKYFCDIRRLARAKLRPEFRTLSVGVSSSG